MRQETRAHGESSSYASDSHIYVTSPRGIRIRAYYVGNGLYIVETHSPREIQTTEAGPKRRALKWDIHIGLVFQNQITRHFEAFSHSRRDRRIVKSVKAGVMALAEEYDYTQEHVVLSA